MLEALMLGGGALAGGLGARGAAHGAGMASTMGLYGLVGAGAVGGATTLSGAATGTWNTATDPYRGTGGRVLSGAWTGAKAGAMLGAGSALLPVAAKTLKSGGATAVKQAYAAGAGDLVSVAGANVGRRAGIIKASLGEVGQYIPDRMVGGYARQIAGAHRVATGHFGAELATMGKRLKWGGMIGAGVGLGMAIMGSVAASGGGPSMNSNRSIY